MRVAAAYGDGDHVAEVFRGCSQSLSEFGVAPSRKTRELLGALRR